MVASRHKSGRKGAAAVGVSQGMPGMGKAGAGGMQAEHTSAQLFRSRAKLTAEAREVRSGS